MPLCTQSVQRRLAWPLFPAMENMLPHSGHSSISVIFDLDGTIADTAPDLVDAANAALAADDIGPAPAEAIKARVGYGARAMLQSGIEALGLESDPEQLRRLSEKLVSHYEQNIAGKTKLFPGFEDAAACLRARGAKLLLCTNKRTRLTSPLLPLLGIGSLFDAIACGDTFPYHKPDPRHITSLVETAGAGVSGAIMVGDSEVDGAAARAAGIPFVAVSFGYAGVPLSELCADAIIDHYSELPALIGHLLERAPGVKRS
jgi:phosphoglycolate phosphatase